jgi:hypothetical protein
MVESAEYSDYVLDRRLACRQLGMNLPPRIMVQKLSEVYAGANAQYRGQTVWSTYFERDYFSGMATDKIAPAKLENAAYALRLAQLLGKAAAPNLIVGRLNLQGQVLFDDGDEIVVEEQNLPQEIIVADPTGAFTDYLSPLDHFAREYALPANKRWRWLGHQGDFVAAYLGAFAEAFSSIQEEYRRRRRAFDSLFRHRKRDSRGSFAYRWEKVLERLDRTDAQALVASLRGNLPNGTAVSH